MAFDERRVYLQRVSTLGLGATSERFGAPIPWEYAVPMAICWCQDGAGKPGGRMAFLYASPPGTPGRRILFAAALGDFGVTATDYRDGKAPVTTEHALAGGEEMR